MNDKYLLARDIINSSEAVAYITKDGVNKTLFYIKKMSADFEFSKKDLKVMGNRGTQYKLMGFKISGSMTIYGVTSEYKKMAEDYAKYGIEPRFDLTTTSNDPSSTIGKETVTLRSVLPDKVNLVDANFEGDIAEEEISFSADNFDLLDEFGVPVNLEE